MIEHTIERAGYGAQFVLRQHCGSRRVVTHVNLFKELCNGLELSDHLQVDPEGQHYPQKRSAHPPAPTVEPDWSGAWTRSRESTLTLGIHMSRITTLLLIHIFMVCHSLKLFHIVLLSARSRTHALTLPAGGMS